MISIVEVPTHGQKLTDFTLSKTTVSKPIFFFTNGKFSAAHCLTLFRLFIREGRSILLEAERQLRIRRTPSVHKKQSCVEKRLKGFKIVAWRVAHDTGWHTVNLSQAVNFAWLRI